MPLAARLVTHAMLAAIAVVHSPASGAAASCLLVGDSTVVGTARALRNAFNLQCETQARERVTTAAILRWPASTARHRIAVIGAGSNDAGGPKLSRNLAVLRAAIHADQVIWLKPYEPRASAIVAGLASVRGDFAIDLARFPSRDRVHPGNYISVARAIEVLANAPFNGATLNPTSSRGRSFLSNALPVSPHARRADIITASNDQGG
ncbi:hypothetical protein Q4F19_08210 [Sphingomonas sp. BIUV-7]|uniref:SGNH/GDSL hydrolase family protein n=2 Tax=Sphingomonas natans TaxID=3063330 RepID=A0ABT8Y7R5_9SPHN|nr:hypothetical protein [Sphingomonas sp. BIUV-7]